MLDQPGRLRGSGRAGGYDPLLWVPLVTAEVGGCTPTQVQQTQAGQAVIQHGINTGCGIVTVIMPNPDVVLGCLIGQAGAAGVTAVVDNPAIDNAVEKSH